MKIRTCMILLFSFIFPLTINACSISQPGIDDSTKASPAQSESPATSLPAMPTNTARSPSQPVFFFPDSANKILPNDILQEISYFAIGGGGAFVDCYDDNYGSPMIDNDPDDMELMHNNTLLTCGWTAGQELVGRVIYPDGRVAAQTFNADENGAGKLSFRLLLSDPEGIYEFEISGDGVDLVSNAYFYQPVVPRAYELDDQTILLHNFIPGEKIQLFLYSCNELKKVPPVCSSFWKFEGWQDYHIKETGDLIINTPVDRSLYYVVYKHDLEVDVGSLEWTKGWVETANTNYDFFAENQNKLREASTQYRRCPIDIETKLNVPKSGKAMVQANTPDGSLLSLYANPRTNSRVKLKVEQGSTFELTGEYSTASETYLPVCFDGKVWWEAYIYDANNVFLDRGYVIEYDEQGRTYLEQAGNESVSTQQVITCGGLKSRLSKGEEARVAFTDGTNMRIRKKPGFSEKILNKVPEGTLISILDGPECVDNSTWWKVLTENGVKGWMTEEQDGVYLLEPLP